MENEVKAKQVDGKEVTGNYKLINTNYPELDELLYGGVRLYKSKEESSLWKASITIDGGSKDMVIKLRDKLRSGLKDALKKKTVEGELSEQYEITIKGSYYKKGNNQENGSFCYSLQTVKKKPIKVNGISHERETKCFIEKEKLHFVDTNAKVTVKIEKKDKSQDEKYTVQVESVSQPFAEGKLLVDVANFSMNTSLELPPRLESGIMGFDELFGGGILLPHYVRNDKCEGQGLVIAIHGTSKDKIKFASQIKLRHKKKENNGDRYENLSFKMIIEGEDDSAVAKLNNFSELRRSSIISIFVFENQDDLAIQNADYVIAMDEKSKLFQVDDRNINKHAGFYKYEKCVSGIRIIHNPDFPKLETGVSGLDEIFYGGIQLPKNEGNGEANGLIISLIGPRGVHKPLLAMQMLQGLTKSIRKYLNFKNESRFYSVNKPKDQLSDMHLNAVVSKMISYVTVDYLKAPEKKTDFCKFMFDTENVLENVGSLVKENELDKRLAEGFLYYNTSTHALHIRREIGDPLGQCNLYCRIKHDSINGYVKDALASDKHSETKWKKEIFDVKFNSHVPKINNTAGNKNYYFSNTPIQQLNSILSDIENINGTDGGPGYVPCIVLDGITQMAFEDLKDVNFTHLERVFRRKALVSILVFNENERDVLTTCNADIIIELGREEKQVQNYTFYRLQILKSIYQSMAYGWHRYKKREFGIEIFCSPHLLLHKHRFMDRTLRATHSGVMDLTFEMFEDEYESDNINDYLSEKEKDKIDKKALKKLYEEFKNADERKVLEQVLLNPVERGKVSTGTVTALIGPPNTCKRFLAMGYAFYSCCQPSQEVEQNALIIFMDKGENTMQKRMLCPAMLSKMNHVTNKGESKKQCPNECHTCYKHLRSFELRMGCIGTDEFCFYLKELLRVAKESGHPINRIIIDDLQKVQYSFPFFSSDSLFLTTVISLCRERNVDILFLCDKEIELAKELSVLADNVIRTERIVSDQSGGQLAEVKLTIDKYSGYDMPGRVYRYFLEDIEKMYECKFVEEWKCGSVKEKDCRFANENICKYRGHLLGINKKIKAEVEGWHKVNEGSTIKL